MNIILLGAPGAGKGTQAQRIEQSFAMRPLSTGDLLRKLTKQESARAAQLRAIMEKGQLIPDALMIAVLAEELDKGDYAEGFILDGFPRTQPQASALDSMLEERRLSIEAVILLHVEEDFLRKRIEGRFFCSQCAINFHQEFNPPKKQGICDECGLALQQRSDDNWEVLRKRLAVFHQQTKPILPYYDSRGLLATIDGTQSIDAVAAAVASVLTKRNSASLGGSHA